MNIYRSPRNGRNFEYFGEDPFLASAMAVGYITGMQKQGVSATVKHFAGNNSEFLRHDSDSVIDQRSLREIYLPAFEAVVKTAHVGSIMDSYNLTNGLHMTQNCYLNIDVARREWGFDGLLMSDWTSTYDAAGAANCGLDLEMPTGKLMNRESLVAAVKSGAVKESTIDEKIRHILITAARFGWLDREQKDNSISVVDNKNDQTALDGAREAIVLLKNEGGILPLDKARMKTILVVGPDAYPGSAVGGGSARVVPFTTVSAVEGIRSFLGTGATVYYDRGVPSLQELARTTEFVTEAQGGRPGAKIEVFAGVDLAGSALASGTVQHIDAMNVEAETFTQNEGKLLDSVHRGRVSRRWTGYYIAPAQGKYIVVLQGAGEGSHNRVYVDDKLTIDNWKLARAYQPWVTLDFSAGPHKVVVEDEQRSPFGGRLRMGIVAESSVVNARAKELAAKADAGCSRSDMGCPTQLLDSRSWVLQARARERRCRLMQRIPASVRARRLPRCTSPTVMRTQHGRRRS